MKLKHLFIILLIVIASPYYAYSSNIVDNNIIVGRYQLFQGQYKFIDIKGDVHNFNALFILDTSTGKLYECDGYQLPSGKEGEILQKKECRPFEEEIILKKK